MLDYVSVERHSYLNSVRKAFSLSLWFDLALWMTHMNLITQDHHVNISYFTIIVLASTETYSIPIQVDSKFCASLYLVFSLLSVRQIISCHSCCFQTPIGESSFYFFSNLFWFRKFVNKEVRMACKFETNIEPEWVIEAYFLK